MANKKNRIILEETFYALTSALVIFILLEIWRPRIVLNYFNLNYLVVLWLVAGAAVLFRKNYN
jgi:hypothetical protein